MLARRLDRQRTDRQTAARLRSRRPTAARRRPAGRTPRPPPSRSQAVSQTTAPQAAASHSPTAATRSITAKNTVAVCHGVGCVLEARPAGRRRRRRSPSDRGPSPSTSTAMTRRNSTSRDVQRPRAPPARRHGPARVADRIERLAAPLIAGGRVRSWQIELSSAGAARNGARPRHRVTSSSVAGRQRGALSLSTITARTPS